MSGDETDTKHSTVYFDLGCVTVFDLFKLTRECALHFRPCERGVKPISHAVLPVSPKRNGESLNKFLYSLYMGNNLKLKTFFLSMALGFVVFGRKVW